jgi:hypothetical protein
MNDTTDVIKDMTLVKQSKTLLNDLAAGRITKQEFLSECAYWGLKFLDSYRFKPLPTMPQEIIDFKNRLHANPNYEAKPEFWRIPHIAVYIQSALKIEGENLGNIGRLKEILNGLPDGDIVSRKKVKDALHEFQGWLIESKRLKHIMAQAPTQDRGFVEKDFLGES